METLLPDNSPFKGASVLIVEDDSLQSLALKSAFSDAGCDDVRTAASMDEILSILRDNAPHILILDSGLTDSSEGWSIAELAIALNTERPLIYFVTGNPESVPDDIACFGEVVAKPVEPEKLLDMIVTKMTGKSAAWANARKIGRQTDSKPDNITR